MRVTISTHLVDMFRGLDFDGDVVVAADITNVGTAARVGDI